jgi:hypothetical protein
MEIVDWVFSISRFRHVKDGQGHNADFRDGPGLHFRFPHLRAEENHFTSLNI